MFLRFIFAITFSFLAYIILNLNFDFDNFSSRLSNIQTTSPSQELKPPNPELPQPPSGSLLNIFEKAAVCSDSNECSNIGRSILQRSGSAVDAAIATLLCNGLMAMQSMGLGGGLLMNIYSHSEQRAYSILSREVAPRLANPEIFASFKNVSQLFESSLSIAVPTEVMGYARAHERFGKLPWTELVQPTIQICHNGYVLSKHQRDALLSNHEMVSKDTHLRNMFFDNATGNIHKVGTHVRPPKELCGTYESLAANGPRSFYTGELAVKIVEDLKDMGGLINARDLSSLKSQLTSSVVFPLGDYLLHLTPPPGSGYILGFIMNILQKFKYDFEKVKGLGGKEMHRIVEALKFGFVKRWELDVEAHKELLENLTCPENANKWASLIDDAHTSNDPQYYGANLNLLSHPEHGTAHISVLAPNGDAVSATSSINYYFGSGRTGARTGILFNNAMSDFTIEGFPNYFDLPNMQHKNPIKPHHSPMSSMSPIIVTNSSGNVCLVVGAAGGSKIISVLVQILVRTLWLKENIKEAIDAARFHHQLLPNVLEYEYGILQDVIEAVEGKGHKTERYRVRGSAVCGVERNGRAVFANADYRKDGGVAGY